MADPQLGVGRLPGRKRPAIWVQRDGRVTVLAYFQSESALAEFLSWKPMTTTTPSRRVTARPGAIA